MRNRVRELRKEYGLLQDELAKKLNVSQQTISRIEKEENSLPAEILIDLSKFFNVSVDYILYLSDYRQTTELAIEISRTMEEGYQLYQLYERMDKTKKKILMSLMNELAKDPA